MESNRTFKVIGRNVDTNIQQKKRVYTSFSDYKKYKDDVIKRYRSYMDVEVYELVKEKWKLVKSLECLHNNGYL